jgi:hypothetical protein
MRGAPGWYAVSGPGTNGFNYTSNNGHSTNHAFATTGSLTVTIDSDSSVANKKLTVTSSLTTLLDQLFAPDALNVVLIDGADTTTPRVQTEWIEPRLAGEGDALTRAIRNTPDLLNFIQCTATPPTQLPTAPVAPAARYAQAMASMAAAFCRQLQ